MRIANTPIRWAICFLGLPQLWVAVTLLTGAMGNLPIVILVGVALLSARTALRSGRDTPAAIGYFLGTGAVIVIEVVIAVWWFKPFSYT